MTTAPTAPTPAATTPPTRTARTQLLAFSAIMLATLLAALDQSIVATALPRIVASLNGFRNLSWIVTAYLLSSTVTIPLYGKLSDLYGRRLLFVIAIVIFLIGSMLSGLSTSMTQLIAFRGLQGLGAGGLIPLAQAAVGDLYSPRERGRYQGYVSSMYGIAALSGPLVGGTLTEAISWRWIFFVNLPLGIAALVVVIRTLVSNPRREHRIDYAGAVTLGLSLCAILLAADWAETTPLSSPRLIGTGVAGLLGLVAFALIERRASEPVVPPILFRNRVLLASISAFLVFGALMFAVAIYAPVYLQDVRGNSPTISGLTMITWSGAWTSASVLSGRLISRTGRYRIFPIIGAVAITIAMVLLTGIGLSTPRVLLCLVFVLGGFGMGFSQQSYTVGTQNAIDPAMLGTGTAALNLFRAIGGSIAVSALGAVLASRVASSLSAQLGSAAGGINISSLLSGGVHASLHTQAVHVALLSGLHTIFLILAAVSVVAIVAALALEERKLRTESPAESRRISQAIGSHRT